MKTRLAALCALALFSVGLAPPSHAWPTWEDVVDTLATLPGTGIDKDEAEAVKFAIREPECAGKIVSYTVAQDYSLIGFVGALKTTKFQSIPNLPKMSKAQCKGYNPSARAYAFIDSQGDKLLGKKTADWARVLLAEQIASGKSALDEEIAALPYVGTILAEWDCACDAAFETNFQTEKLVDQTVGQVIAIATDVYHENFGRALDKLVTAFGPQLACSLAADWSGVSSVPLVNEVASSACNGVAGKLVGWAKDGAVALAEFAGIIGGDHMPPDEYFAKYMQTYVGDPNISGRAQSLYDGCYQYFEPTNMAADTARKACGVLRDRFVTLASGHKPYNSWEYDLKPFMVAQMQRIVSLTSMKTDAEFKAMRPQLRAQCTALMPKLTDANALAYAAHFGKDLVRKDVCDGFFDETYYNAAPDAKFGYWNVAVWRAKAQQILVTQTAFYLSPHAWFGDRDPKTGFDVPVRNVVETFPGKSFDTCKSVLAASCVPSTDAKLGGMERPCCRLTTGVRADGQTPIEGVTIKSTIAKSLASWCRFDPTDPKRVRCGVESARQACGKLSLGGYSFASADNSCKDNALGLASQTCCVIDASIAKDDAAAKAASGFVKGHNLQFKDGGCVLGGGGTASAQSSSRPDDPRIATCSAAYLPACQQALGATACQFASDGFAKTACCEMDAFNGAGQSQPERGRPFNPATDRTDAEIKRAADAVAASNGLCSLAPAPERATRIRGSAKTDPYRVRCIGEDALTAAIARPYRLAACAGVLSPDGWATQPCAELAPPVKLPADITPKGLSIDPGSLPKPPGRGG